MMKIYLLVIICVLVSCTTGKQHNKASTSKDIIVSTIEKPNTAINTDENKIADNSRWTAHADTSNYIIDITFHEKYAIYWYHGQCQYYYSTYKIRDKIELLWSYKTDCLLNMDMLEKSYDLKKYPKKGDSFCSYSLINDSTLKVTYHFPEWTKKINEIAKDSIFPNYFKKEKENN